MPELPEVENVLRGLRSVLKGRRFQQVQILNSAIIKAGRDEFIAGIAGQLIEDLERRGKYILIRLRSGLSLVFHLGMTGRLYFADSEEPREKHTHLLFFIEGLPRQLRHCDARRFGGAYFVDPKHKGYLKGLEKLGPEPLSIHAEAFSRLFSGRQGRIKALLLNQGIVAGLGNIYSDEALHRARIHPLQIAAKLDSRKLRELHGHVVRILRKAIQEGGSSFSDYVDSERFAGKYQNLCRVYGRVSMPCLARGCHGIIRRILVAGRSSYYCPCCQRRRQRNPRR